MTFRELAGQASKGLVLVGNVLDRLGDLPEGSVQCCVTSPPYWGLRDYKLEPTVWGGDPDCAHEWGDELPGVRRDNQHTDEAPAAKSGGKKMAESNHSIPSRGRFCAKCGAWYGCLGAEPTPEHYARNMVLVGEAIYRVLREDGVFWLNIGDSYASRGVTDITKCGGKTGEAIRRHMAQGEESGWMQDSRPREIPEGLSEGDLIGVPWLTAFALQRAGWCLRSDVIWVKCLSGGAWVYAQTQKGITSCMVRDLARLDPATVKLWNGQQWTQVVAMQRTVRRGDEREVVLRSGERISCTADHRWPTQRGLVTAAELRPGDVIETCLLPEPEEPRDCALDNDAAWLAGMYLAEGSRSEDCLQISGHSREEERWQKLCAVAAKFGGYATRTIDGNRMQVRLYGKVLNAIVGEFVSGRTAKDKCFAPVVWRYSDSFLRAMLRGYLEGDGHYDAANSRWRLGFTRNYNLERDLRTVCARLGLTMTLKPCTAKMDGRSFPAFRGTIRMLRSGHHNEKPMAEVVQVRKARCREVYEIAVADDPHLFALASGVLTHNSNPMPESTRNRPTKAHEYLFLFCKSRRVLYWTHRALGGTRRKPKPDYRWYDRLNDEAETAEEPPNWRHELLPDSKQKRWKRLNLWVGHRYFYDEDAIREPHKPDSHNPDPMGNPGRQTFDGKKTQQYTEAGGKEHRVMAARGWAPGGRNKRTIWTTPVANYAGAHFATYPPELIRPAVLAGSSKYACPVCGAPYDRLTEEVKQPRGDRMAVRDIGPEYDHGQGGRMIEETVQVLTLGFTPTCDCEPVEEPVPSVVLDPFLGSGTTVAEALAQTRAGVGTELNEDFAKLARKRIHDALAAWNGSLDL